MSAESDSSVTFAALRAHTDGCLYYRDENRDFTVSSINTKQSCERSAVNMKTRTSIRIRVSRFLSERYFQRERPNYFPELGLFGIMVITAIWPILPLANALAALR